jgi:hypothetical protein
MLKKNASIFSNFNGEKWTKCAVNISAAIWIDRIIDNWKAGGALMLWRALARWWTGGFFLKNRRDVSRPDPSRWTVPLCFAFWNDLYTLLFLNPPLFRGKKT